MTSDPAAAPAGSPGRTPGPVPPEVVGNAVPGGARPVGPRTAGASGGGEPRPGVRMLHDRVLVRLDTESAERLSSSGIVIPATATVGKRLAWGAVVAAGEHVRQVGVGDRVLFDPEDRAEVELGGVSYLLLRERDIHGVAEPQDSGRGPGLYL